MKILLAKKNINAKIKSIDISTIEKELEDGDKIYYFDKKNTHKDMMSFIKHFEKLGKSVYFKETKYGLDDDEYIYEAHIV